MRSDAKPPTAGTNHRLKQSGALAIAALLAMAILAGDAGASQEVFDYFGGASDSGSRGGELNAPRQMAVNSTGAGPADAGDVYVADDFNHRVQRFDSDGNFISAWGANVTRRVETQTVHVVAEEGTFTLTFEGDTTAPIAYNASAGALDNALDVLPSIGADANVAVSSGGPAGNRIYTVTFTGALDGTDVPQLTADAALLSGTVDIETLENGSGGGGSDYEICTVASQCSSAVATGGNETAAGNGALDNPQAVAVDNDTGQVYVSDRDNRRVNVYDGEGNFLRSFGWDVAESGPGNTGAEYEVCVAAEGDVCKKGVGASSPGAGQFHTSTTAGAYGIAVSPADGEAAEGKVFLANSGARRVETFNLDGSSPANFGSSSEFGANQPTVLSVDSRGILYASNSTGGAQVERYDTEDANGGGVGFLDPITPYQNETQRISFSGFVNGDTFTLTCPNGVPTTPIQWQGSSAKLRANIETTMNSSCGQRIAASQDNSPVITFEGGFAGTDVPTMTCTTVDGSGSCVIDQEIDGVEGLLLPGGSTATAGLAVNPDSDGGGADVDELFVLRDPAVGVTVVQQVGPSNEPGLTPPPVGVDDSHGTLAGFSSVLGLGLDGQSGRLLVSAFGDVLGLGSGYRVYRLDEPASVTDPIATMDSITLKTEATAILSGAVDPKGAYTTCAFQYATNPEFIGAVEVNESACPSLGKGGGAQPVSEEVSGLVPNTTYYVRLRASRPFIGKSVNSPLEPFTTDPAPPFIVDVGASQVTETSARLAGTISPNHSATGYIFEYGETPALGSSTAPLAVGDGSDPIVVSRLVKGLTKDTKYYFRLTATNAFGTRLGTQASFRTRAVPLPNPASRVYEQVSPVDKNSGDATASSNNRLQPTGTFVGYDGEGLAFESRNSFAKDPASQISGVKAVYASRRGPAGWSTRSVNPPSCVNDLDNPVNIASLLAVGAAKTVSSYVEGATFLQREAASCTSPPLDGAAMLPALNLYRADLTTQPSGYDLLIPEPEPDKLPLELRDRHGEYVAGSDDYGHIVLASEGQQTPDAPAGSFDKLYEWDEGTFRLVSVDPNGEPFTTRSTVLSGGGPRGSAGDTPVPLGINGGWPDMRNAVSADGERILFQNPTATGGSAPCSGACALYMREGGAATHRVSESECTSDCGGVAPKEFRWASLDGAAVSFVSAEKLTNDDPTDADSGNEDLYLYRHTANPSVEPNLTLVSGDAEPADGGGDVLGVAGMSDDGETIYFVADNQLVAGAPTGGEENFYRWTWNDGEPTLQYLATVVQDQQINHQNSDTEEKRHVERRVSRDGSALMIETSERLLPGADTDADFDVYIWRVKDGWSCVSCQAPGEPSGGRSITGRVGFVDDDISGGDPQFDRELSGVITEDGERVFFETQDALVPADANGSCVRTEPLAGYYPCLDIYEWHDGRLSLITTGTGSTDAGLIGISESGRDVLFYTREKLIGWDKDELIDIYDARIGGGFPEPPPQPPECEGEGCRDEGTDAPAIVGAGTAVFQGAGNPKSEPASKPCPANRLRRGKRCLPLRAIARKRCRRLRGAPKRRCIRRQTRRLRRAQRRRAQRAHRRALRSRAANDDRRASR